MKIEKEKRKVNIICNDGSLVKGFVHINPGERIVDFLNDEKEKFIVVTEASLQNIGVIHSFKIYNELTGKKKVIILNKSCVKIIEEI